MILVLEDNLERIGWFFRNIGSNELDWTDCPGDAVDKLCHNKYDKIYLGYFFKDRFYNGLDVARAMRDLSLNTDAEVILHGYEIGAKAMLGAIKNTHPKAHIIPFERLGDAN